TLGGMVKIIKLTPEASSMDVEIVGLAPFNKLYSENFVVNCKESGLCARMVAPVLGLFQEIKSEKMVTGEGSLLKRPFDMAEQLEQFGLSVHTTDGKLPLTVTGNLIPNEGRIDGSLTSQMLSGLLMTLPLLSGDSYLIVENPSSKPYIELTIDTMRKFGVDVFHDGYFTTFEIRGNQKYNAIEFNVEGDWSGGAFLLVLGVLLKKEGVDIRVSNLAIDSKQGDKAILDVLESVGVRLTYENGMFCIEDYDVLKAFEFDACDCPDLVPPLVCLAAFCDGESKVHGVERLRYKESNRLEALSKLLSTFGVENQVLGDVFVVKGLGKDFARAGEVVTVDSYKDHRIAMAGTVLALKTKMNTVIKTASCVSKSFPNFFEQVGTIVG
ncbi:MAG: 3-phosphoshikimate 1-carboxyvinyltransferase, partial [Fervidobacterium pennivorans]